MATLNIDFTHAGLFRLVKVSTRTVQWRKWLVVKKHLITPLSQQTRISTTRVGSAQPSNRWDTCQFGLRPGLKCVILKIGKLNNSAKRLYGLAGLVTWLECFAVHISGTLPSVMVGAAPTSRTRSDCGQNPFTGEGRLVWVECRCSLCPPL